MGFGAKVIAPVAGTTENAISIRLTRMKKKAPGKAKQQSTEATSTQ
jgi:hypothetical protein